MSIIANLVTLSNLKIEDNDLAETMRMGLVNALEGWRDEKDERRLNLDRLLPIIDWRAKDDVRHTIGALTNELAEFGGRII